MKQEQCKECKLTRGEIEESLQPLIELANALGIKTTRVEDRKGIRLLKKNQRLLSKECA